MNSKKILIVLICILAIFVICISISNLNQNISFNDVGTANNKTNDWISNNISLVKVTEYGTEINNTSPKNIAYFAHSDEYWAKAPLCIEFDVVNTTGKPIIHIFDGKNDFQGELAPANGSHVKILIDKNVRCWIGNDEQTSLNQPLDKCYIRFLVPPESSITYKNFKISSF